MSRGIYTTSGGIEATIAFMLGIVASKHTFSGTVDKFVFCVSTKMWVTKIAKNPKMRIDRRLVKEFGVWGLPG